MHFPVRRGSTELASIAFDPLALPAAGELSIPGPSVDFLARRPRAIPVLRAPQPRRNSSIAERRTAAPEVSLDQGKSGIVIAEDGSVQTMMSSASVTAAPTLAAQRSLKLRKQSSLRNSFKNKAHPVIVSDDAKIVTVTFAVRGSFFLKMQPVTHQADGSPLGCIISAFNSR
jgi:hypothetical protein